MKVLLINGSPHRDGCIARALKELEDTLNKENIETEVIHIGDKAIRGCISCYSCKKSGKCVFDDEVNIVGSKLKEADGIVIGTPTYFAGSNGTIISFLDRLFYSIPYSVNLKVGAAVISSRRAGSTSALDEINKYFLIRGMAIAGSTYWNEVHGYSKEDVELDLEGLQTMRNLGRNMAFLIKSINLGKKEFKEPLIEHGVHTSFFNK